MLTIDQIIGALQVWFLGLMPYLYILLLVTFANLVLGVAVALNEGEFEWAKLAGFLYSDILSKVVAWLAISLVAELAAVVGFDFLGEPLGPEITNGLARGLWALVMLSLGGDILAKVAKIGWRPAARLPGVSSGEEATPLS